MIQWSCVTQHILEVQGFINAITMNNLLERNIPTYHCQCQGEVERHTSNQPSTARPWRNSGGNNDACKTTTLLHKTKQRYFVIIILKFYRVTIKRVNVPPDLTIFNVTVKCKTLGLMIAVCRRVSGVLC